ncbi:MAG TPA: PAS domain-containing protein [Alphaproteobacteria bacterium]|jgi:hypothetical protein|nr:PAS domain-containing protein [Alphaproteobacteria bacterium]
MDDISAKITDKTTRAFYDYWKDRKAGGQLPRWHDFDPVEMRDWLGWINVVEVAGEGDGCRFRYRVHGDQLSDFLGVEMTGKFADEIPRASVRERAMAGYRVVADKQAPDLVRYVDTHANERLVRVERLTVPVLDGDTMLLVSFFRFEP